MERGLLLESAILSERPARDLLRVPLDNQDDRTAHLFMEGVSDTPDSVSSATGGSSASSPSSTSGSTSSKTERLKTSKESETSSSSSQVSIQERKTAYLASTEYPASTDYGSGRSRSILSGSKKKKKKQEKVKFKFKFEFEFGSKDVRENPELESLPGGQRPGAWPGPPATCGTTERRSSLESSSEGGLSSTGLSLFNIGEAAGGPVRGVVREEHYSYQQKGSDAQARLPRTNLYAVSLFGLGTTKCTLGTDDPYKNGLTKGGKSVAEREAGTGKEHTKHHADNPIPGDLQ